MDVEKMRAKAREISDLTESFWYDDVNNLNAGGIALTALEDFIAWLVEEAR